jgi:hypothetical protein
MREELVDRAYATAAIVSVVSDIAIGLSIDAAE